MDWFLGLSVTLLVLEMTLLSYLFGLWVVSELSRRRKDPSEDKRR
jgi:hypothetical protein